MSRDGTLPPGVEHWDIEDAQEPEGEAMSEDAQHIVQSFGRCQHCGKDGEGYFLCRACWRRAERVVVDELFNAGMLRIVLDAALGRSTLDELSGVLNHAVFTWAEGTRP